MQLNRHYFGTRNDQNDLTSSHNTITLFKSKFAKHIFSVFKTFFFLRFVFDDLFELNGFTAFRLIRHTASLTVLLHFCYRYLFLLRSFQSTLRHNIATVLQYSEYCGGRTEMYEILLLSDANDYNGSQFKLPVNREL